MGIALSAKGSLFVCYLIAYYLILLAFASFFFFVRLRQLRFVGELSFFANFTAARLVLLLAVASLAGLPPLFFFFPKLAALATIVLLSPWYLSVLLLLLIALGWFIYLNALRAFGGQGWSFAGAALLGGRYVSTYLPCALLLLLLIFLVGFLFFADALLTAAWLFG